MKKLLALLAAGIGALAFWRRKTLKDDVERVKDTSVDAAAKVKDRLRPAEDTADSADEAGGEGVDEGEAEASDESEDAGSETAPAT